MKIEREQRTVAGDTAKPTPRKRAPRTLAGCTVEWDENGLGTATEPDGTQWGVVQFEGGCIAYMHHITWESVHGPVPDGYWPVHICGDTLCQQPKHLVLEPMPDPTTDANGNPTTVPRLVMGLSPDDPREVIHLDGDPANADPANLKIVNPDSGVLYLFHVGDPREPGDRLYRWSDQGAVIALADVQEEFPDLRISIATSERCNREACEARVDDLERTFGEVGAILDAEDFPPEPPIIPEAY